MSGPCWRQTLRVKFAARRMAMAYNVPALGGNLPRLRNLITSLTLGLISAGDVDRRRVELRRRAESGLAA
jgi:hypothetical protein